MKVTFLWFFTCIAGALAVSVRHAPGDTQWFPAWRHRGISDGMIELNREPRNTEEVVDFQFPDEEPHGQEQIAARVDPYDDNHYSDKEKECLEHRMFLHDGKCHKLKSEATCATGEWLVLDKYSTDALKPVCTAKPCKGKDEVWWPATEKCETKAKLRAGPCNAPNREIYLDSYGDGTCVCQREYGEMESDATCHQYYQQGPCRSNEVIVHDPTSGYAKCSVDRCSRENQEPAKTKSRASRLPKAKAYAPLEGTGACHKLGSVGPCSTVHKQSRYVINEYDRVPRCSEPTNELNIIDAPVLCRLGDNNLCKSPVSIQQDNRLSYLNNLKEQLKRKAG